MFFTHDRAWEEFFCVCIQLLNKTWKEMRATAEDFNKVCHQRIFAHQHVLCTYIVYICDYLINHHNVLFPVVDPHYLTVLSEAVTVEFSLSG